MPFNEANVIQIFDTAKGYAPVNNLIAAGDPDVHKFGDRWWMFLGGAHTANKVNLFSASLPPGAPLNSPQWTITTDPSDPHTALPLVEQPEVGRWDEWLHTPSYVRGVALGATGNSDGGSEYCERIYYTGSSGAASSFGDSDDHRNFSIGMMEKTGDGWVRREDPVIVGTDANPRVFEPKTRYYEGKWRIWYLSAPYEAGPGELPQYRIEYVESDDGVTGWSKPKVLFPEADNYFDAVVTESGDSGYEMVVARGPNIFGTPGFPSQGLWWLSSRLPSGDRSDWTRNPVRILDADNGEPWYASGVYGPSLRYGDTPADRNTLYVFFTGAAKPEPDPYVISVGRIEIRSASPGR